MKLTLQSTVSPFTFLRALLPRASSIGFFLFNDNRPLLALQVHTALN